MNQIREVADSLRDTGLVEVSQRGVVINSAVNAKGPIRLGLTKS